MTRVLVVANDVVQKRMAGPGIRAMELARQIAAAGHDVVLATPTMSDVSVDGVTVRSYQGEPLERLARGRDAAVVQGWVLDRHPRLPHMDLGLVVDLYDPLHLEGLIATQDHDLDAQQVIHRRTLGVINSQLRRGDFFLCASEKQRDLYLGALAALDRVNPMTIDADPTLRRLVDVVPFGIPSNPPAHARNVMRGVQAGITDDDLVLLWGGGIYDWFDPLTVLRGLALARDRVPRVRAVFHAGRHPNALVPVQAMAARARALSDELGLTGLHAFFNDEWVAYEERGDWLLEADIGVSAHVSGVETTYSFRTRMLDYIWAGLPIICTAGDTFGDLVAGQGLGVAVPERSPEAFAEAIVTLADPDGRARCAGRVRKISSELTWARAAEPLIRYCQDPWRAPDLGRRGHAPRPVPLHARPDRPDALGGALRAAHAAGEEMAVARRAFRRGGPRALMVGLGRRLRRRA